MLATVLSAAAVTWLLLPAPGVRVGSIPTVQPAAASGHPPLAKNEDTDGWTAIAPEILLEHISEHPLSSEPMGRLAEGRAGKWTVAARADGTELLQLDANPEFATHVFIGEPQALPVEFRGTLDYRHSSPAGRVLLDVCGIDSANEGGQCALLNRHLPSAVSCDFRIVVYRDRNGVAARTVRYLPDSRFEYGLGKLHVDADYAVVGFSTDTRLRIHKLKTRALPPGWTVEKDPDFALKVRRARTGI